jgi:flagellin
MPFYEVFEVSFLRLFTTKDFREQQVSKTTTHCVFSQTTFLGCLGLFTPLRIFSTTFLGYLGLCATAYFLAHLASGDLGVGMFPKHVHPLHPLASGVLKMGDLRRRKMIVNHNMSSIAANRVLKFKTWDLGKSIAKLASGERITKASDDASGLAVSEKMRTQVYGLRQAERNTEDGISFIQTADGYLDQVANVLQRIRVLSVQSANGIYGADDRTLLQVEVSQLFDEVNRVSSQAEFNRFKVLLGDFARDSKTGSMWFHMGPNMNQRERAYVQTMTATALGIQGISLTSAASANAAIGLVDTALTKLMKQRADLGAYSNRLEIAAKGLMSAYENVQAAESRIRDADMAEEMVTFTRDKILQAAAVSMLVQANMSGQGVLRLLNG